MTRAILFALLRTLALLLALGGVAAAAAAPAPAPAGSAGTPTLRASVTVDSNIVRIGDLVENAGPVAGIPIFRAPDLGTSGAVATDRVIEAISPHQLIGIDTRGLSEVIVTRASRVIAPREISERVAEVLAGQYGFGEARNVQVTFDRELHTLAVEPSATGELQVVSLAYDPRSSRFDVTFDLPSSVALHRQPARYTGTAIDTVDTVAVDRPVETGEVLQVSDLTIVHRPKAQAGGAIGDVKSAIGLAARHALRPNQPLYAADLMKPQIVRANDTVTIVYQVPGLTLTLRGNAQQAGAIGDSISVLNRESKRVVEGVVTGPGEVTISPVITRLTENTAGPVAVPAPQRAE